MTIQEITKKFENIEDKIPSVWATWEIAAGELARDIAFEWMIREGELIRVIALVGMRVPGMKLDGHIDPMFAFAGLYPERMKSFDILPDGADIALAEKLKQLGIEPGYKHFIPLKDESGAILDKVLEVREGTSLYDKLTSINGKLPKYIVI